MNNYTVTVTSKNQITLPAELVRSLNLSKNRQLLVKQQAGEIKMQVQPSLRQSMAKYKQAHYAKVPLQAKDMSEAAAQIIAKKATR